MAGKTDKLNIFLADLAVLNIKVHNLHWNVVGPQFKAVHKMTEKIYKMLQHQFDEVAEMMKTEGKLPAGSMADFLDLTTLEELESRDYTVYEVLDELSADCEALQTTAKEARDEADKKDNFIVANKLEEYLAVYAKKAWMLRAMLTEDDETDTDADDEEMDDEEDDEA